MEILLVLHQALRVRHCPTRRNPASVHDLFNVNLALLTIRCVYDVGYLEDMLRYVPPGVTLSISGRYSHDTTSSRCPATNEAAFRIGILHSEKDQLASPAL
jgi:hypothetical protein